MTTAPDSPLDRRLLGLVAAIAAVGLVLIMPPPSGLSPEGWRAAALFAGALILWVSEAVPIAITAMLVVIMQPVLGLSALGPALGTFMSPVIFFVLAMFVIAQAFAATGLDSRFAHWLLARAGDSPRRILFAFVLGCGTLSTIVSDVPACAIFMAIAVGLFDRLGLAPGRSQFARSLMVGIPIASLIGGVGTPAGSSVNVLGLFLIEQHGGVRVSFVEWMAIGMPMVAVLLPLSAMVLARFFPAEMSAIDPVVARGAGHAGAMRPAERRVLATLATMVVLWVASSWYPRIDLVIVAVLGATALFLPGMGIFESWRQVERGTSWDALLMIGGVTSLGVLTAQTGLAAWLVQTTLAGLQAWPVFVVIAAICAFTAVVHLVLPVNPAIVAALIPPIVLLARESGQHPALYGLPVAFTASCAFLLPFDAVALVTYGAGYYRIVDMLKPGSLISVAWVVLMTALLVTIGPLVGIF